MLALLLGAATVPNLPAGAEVPLQEYILCLANFSPEQREQIQNSNAQDRVKLMGQKISGCSEIRSRSIRKIEEISKNSNGFEDKAYRSQIINTYFNGADCQFIMMASSFDVKSGTQSYMGCYKASEINAPNN